MKPLQKMSSNNKIVTFLTALTVLIKTNTAAPNDQASSSTPVGKTYSQIELSLACKNLPRADIRSLSDPFVRVFEQELGQARWKLIGTTERIKDNHNPVFQTKIIVTHIFEEKQLLKFEVHDADHDDVNSVEGHNFLGSLNQPLGVLTSARRKELKLISQDQQREVGSIIITAIEMGADNGKVLFGIRGLKLDKKDTFTMSNSSGADPYLEIVKHTYTDEKGNDMYAYVHHTEVIKSNRLNPDWKVFEIPVWLLCNGDYNRRIKFLCWDYNKNKKNSFIGEFTTTLKDLTYNHRNDIKNTFYLINEDKKKKNKKYTHSGEIQIHHFRIEPVYTFIDYIQGGTQIYGTVAIDFTKSNQRQLLHEIRPGEWNSYEQAIYSIVSIIEDYDTDKQFAVLGFGATLDGESVLHDFHVNLNAYDSNCQGVQGVLDAYRNCLPKISMRGPTNFHSVINYVSFYAEKIDVGTGYFILLILTDGDVDDLQETKEAIIRASFLPISIIIVGLGNESFETMEDLAAVKNPLLDENKQKVRDIVHFVRFQGTPTFNQHIGFSQLAKDVLAEIPEQFMAYMKSKQVLPNNKFQRDYYNYSN